MISGKIKRGKKGQATIELPFQMIFSLILIAIFIYAAFTGIKYFLERADQAKINSFIAEIKSDVGSAWQATEVGRVYTYNLPDKIKSVCFGNLGTALKNNTCPQFEKYRKEAYNEGANMFFCPPSSAYGVGSPYYYKIECDGSDCLSAVGAGVTCIKNNGKISIALEKKLGNPKVVISA